MTLDARAPAPGAGLFVAGIVIQLAAWLANAAVRRHVGDVDTAAQARFIVALVADALTVVLFAIGTFRAIASATTLQ
mgnify:CR=1 FL=1|jgi:hypothetical protein